MPLSNRIILPHQRVLPSCPSLFVPVAFLLRGTFPLPSGTVKSWQLDMLTAQKTPTVRTTVIPKNARAEGKVAVKMGWSSTAKTIYRQLYSAALRSFPADQAVDERTCRYPRMASFAPFSLCVAHTNDTCAISPVSCRQLDRLSATLDHSP